MTFAFVRCIVAAGTVSAMAAAGVAAHGPALSAADAIRTAIVSRLGVDATVTVESIDVTGSAPVFRDARPDPAGRLGKPMRFTLLTEGGGTLPATATLTVTGPLVVTTRLVRRGEVLKPEDLHQSSRVLEGLPIRRLPHLSELVGSRTLRALALGEAVPDNAVAIRRKVEPGDPVTVVAAAGAVEVTATFVAADGGHVGAVIRVVNPETRRFLRGRVLNDGKVEVIDGR